MVISYFEIRRSVVAYENVGEELEELEACDVESLKTKWRIDYKSKSCPVTKFKVEPDERKIACSKAKAEEEIS